MYTLSTCFSTHFAVPIIMFNALCCSTYGKLDSDISVCYLIKIRIE